MRLLLLLFLPSVVVASSACGVRLGKDTNGTIRHKRVIGGNNVTTAGRWPWQILMRTRQFKNGTQSVKSCGGTVIGDRWVLTAAHCVRYAREDLGQDVTVEEAFVFGEVTDAKSNSIVDAIINNHAYRILEAYPHSNYSTACQTCFEHDIALIKLENPIDFDDAVSPICLPHHEQEIPHDGQAVATGFGCSNKRGKNETFDDEQLRETIVPIVREDICEERWLKSNLNFTLDGWRNLRVICAGAFGHDTHWGDSGGPLMMKSSDRRWFQIGITSFGDPSVEADKFPGAYTDVREYCEWIDETTKGEAKCQEETVELQDVEIKI